MCWKRNTARPLQRKRVVITIIIVFVRYLEPSGVSIILLCGPFIYFFKRINAIRYVCRCCVWCDGRRWHEHTHTRCVMILCSNVVCGGGSLQGDNARVQAKRVMRCYSVIHMEHDIEMQRKKLNNTNYNIITWRFELGFRCICIFFSGMLDNMMLSKIRKCVSSTHRANNKFFFNFSRFF